MKVQWIMIFSSVAQKWKKYLCFPVLFLTNVCGGKEKGRERETERERERKGGKGREKNTHFHRFI